MMATRANREDWGDNEGLGGGDEGRGPWGQRMAQEACQHCEWEPRGDTKGSGQTVEVRLRCPGDSEGNGRMRESE